VEPVRLADVQSGTTARLTDTRLESASRALLRALGLTDGSVLRVCQQGEPCVIQVRATRIGLSSRVARDVFIVPVEAPPAGEPAA
jgi:Fe2+ transport system protein FeoA